MWNRDSPVSIVSLHWLVAPSSTTCAWAHNKEYNSVLGGQQVGMVVTDHHGKFDPVFSPALGDMNSCAWVVKNWVWKSKKLEKKISKISCHGACLLFSVCQIKNLNCSLIFNLAVSLVCRLAAGWLFQHQRRLEAPGERYSRCCNLAWEMEFICDLYCPVLWGSSFISLLSPL